MVTSVATASGGEREAAPFFFPAIAAFAIAFGVPTALIAAFNYFVGPMGKELGLTSIELSQALFWYMIVLVVALPLAGSLVDRIGARRVIQLSSLACGLSFFWISRAGGSMLELDMAFAFGSFAGAGTSAVAYNRVVVHRFERRRGLALGVTMTGAGIGPILVPAIVRPIIVEHGWRAGFLTLAIVCCGVGLVASLFAGARPLRTASFSSGPGLKDALADSSFWKMALAAACLGTVSAGFLAHLSEIWKGQGLELATVPRFQAIFGAAGIVGRLLGGALMDRIAARYVAAGGAVLGAIGLGCIGLGFNGPAPLILAGFAFGCCVGVEGDAISFLSRHYFGLDRFARVYSTQFALLTIGFAVGPLAVAACLAKMPAASLLQGCAVLLGISALIYLSLPGSGRSGLHLSALGRRR